MGDQEEGCNLPRLFSPVAGLGMMLPFSNIASPIKFQLLYYPDKKLLTLSA
jgi:hypothetical protein